MTVNQAMLNNIIECLDELKEDSTVPRNIKNRIDSIILILRDSKDENNLSINISKALGTIEEICDDSNIQPYTRTQIWNIASALEAVQL